MPRLCRMNNLKNTTMKNYNLWTMALFSAFVISCKSQETPNSQTEADTLSVKEKTEIAADTLKADWQEQKAELEQKTNSAIQRLDSRIDSLKANAREKSKDEIKRLEASREELKDRIKTSAQVTRENWEEYKRELDRSLEKVDRENGQ